ncbi:protein-methionine sulfoxide oxidase mical2b [Onychostoma macrolepis]|uniref:MICAL-like protein 2 n=1 Tax=Onychostoma macrolepis TaxID=369639 RepID=A0A7J6DI64_9TELE|nr:protein-methionine sulfoxide oxidase mical2b [Onychostoma macrolepis]KAF4119023.1 hypothetical protein G5714_001074 [Onychostoma macrolepis]
MAAVKALQQWCKIKCEGYRDVSITNMTTSFRDGLAFCALIHKHRPDLIDFDSLSKENIYENNKQAFEVAEKELGIPALLDAEDMVALKVPDRLSILTYVSQYYNYFHGRSPIGGMAGIKRPAEESNEAPSEKKNHQPVTAKVFPSPKPATENKTPKPANENKREVLAERANKTTLSSSCNVCNQHVHLVQRHLVDGKLYHRNCFKCRECSTILLSGTYKPGKEMGTFICKTHTSIEKPVTVPTTHITVTSPKTPSAFISKTNQNASGDTGKSGLTPNSSKLSWTANKSDRAPTRELAATPTPAVRHSPAPKTTPAPEATTVKTSFSPRTPTESLKPVSNSVQMNQEARMRFFESSSNPSSIVPASKSTSSYTSTISVSTASVKTPTPESTAPRATAGAAAGKGRVLLRVGDWTKTQDAEKEKENEKEKAKAVIGKMVTVEKNNNSSLSPAGLKANNSNVSPVESGAKGPSGRVRLKALDASVEPTAPAAAAPSWIKDKTSRPASMLSSNSKENDTAPSDWRSMLKPVKTVGSTENTGSPSKKPEAASSPRTSGLGISQTSVPAPSTTSISISINSPKAPSPSPMKNGPKSSDSSSGSIVSPVSPPETETHKLHKPGYIPKEEIQKELKEIEMNMNELEKRGVELEKQLRQCDEEGKEDTLMNDLMVDWFTLIRNKQVYMRRESELVYIAKTQDLEEEQPSVDAELRKLLDKPEHLKTSWDRKREEELMAKLVGIVNDRNAIVEGLDEDRLREEEEDEQLNKMMQNLDMKKEKVKRKSISRWFSLKSKRPSAED